MHINGPLPQQSLWGGGGLCTNCGALFWNICIANWDYGWLQLAQVPVALFSHNKNKRTWCWKSYELVMDEIITGRRCRGMNICSGTWRYICHATEARRNPERVPQQLFTWTSGGWLFSRCRPRGHVPLRSVWFHFHWSSHRLMFGLERVRSKKYKQHKQLITFKGCGYWFN